VGQVRDLRERDFPLPEIARESVLGRQSFFSELPVPLGPHCLFAVTEVERLDDRPALPAVIGWVRRLVIDIPAGGYLA
jgi:hypothetical protein